MAIRKTSKSTSGAQKNARALYGGKSAAGKAYTKAAKSAVKSGKSGMAAHKAGMSGAGLS